MDTLPRIQLFGRNSVFNSQGEEIRIASKKGAMLFAYLVVHSDHTHSREFLADLFWPEESAEVSRHNLRQALNTIRRSLNHAIEVSHAIKADKSSIWFHNGDFNVDFHQFEKCLASASTTDCKQEAIQQLCKAVELSSGEFLQGMYDQWVGALRTRLEISRIRALSRLQELFIELDNPMMACDFIVRAIESDPYAEDLRLAAIRAFAASGLPDKVKDQFDSYSNLISSELSLAPTDEFESVYCQSMIEANLQRSAMIPHFWQRPFSVRERTSQSRFRSGLKVAAACFAFIIASSQPAREAGTYDSLSTFLKLPVRGAGVSEPKVRAQRWKVIASSAFSDWYGPDEVAWVHRIDKVRQELGSSLSWMLLNDPESALEVSAKLVRYWYLTERYLEGSEWIQAILDSNVAKDSKTYALAMIGLANLTHFTNPEAASQLMDAVSIYESQSDMWGTAHARRHLGLCYAVRNEYWKANEQYHVALNVFEKIGDKRARALTLFSLACAPTSGKIAPELEAKKVNWSRVCLELFQEIGNEWGIIVSSEHYKSVLKSKGDPAAILIEIPKSSIPKDAASALEVLERQRNTFDVAKHPGEYLLLLAKIIEISGEDHRLWSLSLNIWNVVRDPRRFGDVRLARILGGIATIDRNLGVRQDKDGEEARNDLLANIGAKCGKERADFEYRVGASLTSWETAKCATTMLRDEASKLVK